MDLHDLRDLLAKASGCPLEVQPIQSKAIGRRGLLNGSWDFAFLSPSLTVMALQQQQTPYTAIRTLGLRVGSRSSILVPEGSSIRGYGDLNGARLGLLQKGDLLGYYLPIYNLYGVRLAGIRYGSDFEALARELAAGTIDAMVWDAKQTPMPKGTRLGAVDPHRIPAGALVMRSTLNDSDYRSMLSVLDDNAFQLPTSMGYSSGSIPDRRSYYHVTRIVRDVDSWQEPVEVMTEAGFSSPAPKQKPLPAAR
jgi:phosphonate transport system substrate-binding protein